VLFQCLKLQDLFLSVDLVRQRQRASDPVAMEEDEDNHGRASATDEDGGGFCVDVELLE
jgi:hypothetical protein